MSFKTVLNQWQGSPASDRPKFPRAAAIAVAKELCDLVRPCVSDGRLKVCGSLRRGKQWVGDVEIVFVPGCRQVQETFFEARDVDLVGELLDRLLQAGTIRQRLAVNGRLSSWGKENKHAVHVASGIPIDFFATSESNWWNTVVIRTGSKEMNLRLTTSAIARGLTLNAYGAGFTHLRTREKIPCTSEADVFKIAGVPYLEPWQR